MNNLSDIIAKADLQFDAKLPFVLYSKPNSEKLIGIFQRNTTLHFVNDFNEKGFVFAPFDGDEIVLIPEKHSEIQVSDYEKTSTLKNNFQQELTTNQEAESHFEDLVRKGIAAIDSGDFNKVVLSRKEFVAVTDMQPTAIFQKLHNEYPTAFAYCFYHPQIGLWFGAFSEQLLKIENDVLHTMAVAGTQPFHDNQIIWGEKEKDEQQFVTDFIVENLSGIASDISVSEPYSMKAGNIVHIKTDIKGKLNTPTGLKQVLAVLHPTPAVCGLPKLAAKDFILENEDYEREYYSGFFGEFNKDFATSEVQTDLYVNLRCMQIKEEQAELYIGCGITKDSIPANEWQETVNKSQTMKRILTDSN